MCPDANQFGVETPNWMSRDSKASYLQTMLGLSFASSRHALCCFTRRAASPGLSSPLSVLPVTVDVVVICGWKHGDRRDVPRLFLPIWESESPTQAIAMAGGPSFAFFAKGGRSQFWTTRFGFLLLSPRRTAGPLKSGFGSSGMFPDANQFGVETPNWMSRDSKTSYLQTMLGLSFASSRHALCCFTRRAASPGLSSPLSVLPVTVDVVVICG